MPLPRILLVQDDSTAATTLRNVLEQNSLEVIGSTNVKEALMLIAAQSFDALLCDLHLPGPGDGFTLVNAMRHSHPRAITMLLSSYPSLNEAMSAILLRADEIVVKPVNSATLVALLKKRLRNPQHDNHVVPKETVADILERDQPTTIRQWLTRVNENKELNFIRLGDKARTGHLPKLLTDLVQRLRLPRLREGTAKISKAASAHGMIRSVQGYTAAMIVEESRNLQVCIFQTLQNNLSTVDFSRVLVDVMTIADEVDSQLKQTLLGFESVGKQELTSGRKRSGTDASVRLARLEQTYSLLGDNEPRKPHVLSPRLR